VLSGMRCPQERGVRRRHYLASGTRPEALDTVGDDPLEAPIVFPAWPRPENGAALESPRSSPVMARAGMAAAAWRDSTSTDCSCLVKVAEAPRRGQALGENPAGILDRAEPS